MSDKGQFYIQVSRSGGHFRLNLYVQFKFSWLNGQFRVKIFDLLWLYSD